MPLRDLQGPAYKKLVADALEHLWDYAYLGRHPLADLNCVKQRALEEQGRSHVDDGRALSEVLQEAIETLRPAKREGKPSREKHYYEILKRAYIDGSDNEMIAHSLHIAERTLYRYLGNATWTVGQILRDWEK